MTNIPPTSGPPPEDFFRRIDPDTGSFSNAMDLTLKLSATHASTLINAVDRMLKRPAPDAEAQSVKTDTQSLAGVMVRLAACKEVAPGHIAALSRHVDMLSYGNTSLSDGRPVAAQISETLKKILKDPVALGHGAGFALAHAMHVAERLQTPASNNRSDDQSTGWSDDQPAAPASRIPLLAQDTLNLASRLVGRTTRNTGPDPSQALLVQGMAGTLHAITSRVPDEPGHDPVLTSLRGILTLLTNAKAGNVTIPSATLGTDVASRIDRLDTLITKDETLRTGVNLAVRSLKEDGVALQTAIAAEAERAGRAGPNDAPRP